MNVDGNLEAGVDEIRSAPRRATPAANRNRTHDFFRNTFYLSKYFEHVLMQQGRVQACANSSVSTIPVAQFPAQTGWVAALTLDSSTERFRRRAASIHAVNPRKPPAQIFK